MGKSIYDVPNEITPQVTTESIWASPQPSGTLELKASLQPSGTPELKASHQPSGTPEDEIYDEIDEEGYDGTYDETDDEISDENYFEIYDVVVRYFQKKTHDDCIHCLISRVPQLQEELKKVQDQLGLSGSWKNQAHQNAEESKKQLVAMSSKLEGSKQQLLEPSGPEEESAVELQEIERAKQKFLEQYGSEKELALAVRMISEELGLEELWDQDAVQKQNAVDFVILASAMDDIQQLKVHRPVKRSRSRLLEWEPKVLELQVEMKKVKDLLSSSEWKNQGHQNAEEFKKKLSAMSSRVEGPKQVFLERYGSEEELAVALQEPDPAQYSNQEATQKQNAVDSVALASTMNETQQLKAERKKRCHQRLPIFQIKVCQLEVDLEKVKDHMSLSESWKNENAKESKEHLLAVSSKLEGSKQRLLELFGSEEGAIEHQKILQEPDPTQHSEQEAVQKQLKVEPKVVLQLQKELKQNAVDCVALASAMNEIQQLMVQLESEAAKTKHLESANLELQSLKGNLAETVSLVENMKKQLQECKESEAQAQAQAVVVTEQLEAAQSANSEMEAELRKLKVQSDQWRKVAERGADMLSSGIMERTGSLDGNYKLVLGKKENVNILKKIGGLWKKPRK